MCMQDTTKNRIFTLIGYGWPYMHVTSQLFSPAHSPSAMHAQPITLQDIYYLLLRHWMLPAFIQIKSGIVSKNGFSYEYRYDFNQLTALYLKMLAPKGRLSLRSKDDCIRLWLRCDFTLQTRFTKVSKLAAG